jgi:CubicO group peptidase (beta-lactamase class C family)
MMAADGTFGAQGIDRKAFNLTVSGANNGGLLNISPWPSLGDTDMAQITIRHLLDHKSGFDTPDCIFRDGSRQIATEMSLGRPPTNPERIRWMLGKPLPYTPGASFYYSNFGYMVLGYIVEQHGGGYLSFLRSRVLTAAGWIPESELAIGKTLVAGRLAREPRYSNGGTGQSVFDYTAPIESLSTSYGGEFDMEALLGAGNLVASAPAMLDFGNRFRIFYPNAGVPVTGPLTDDGHDGGLAGLSSKIEVLPGNTVIFFAFNKDNSVGGLWPQIKSTIQAGTAFTWPATTSDGHWIALPAGDPNAGYGGYDAPWQGFGSSLTKTNNGSRLRLKAGASNWTGTISKRVRLDAPLGSARIGVP